MAEEKIAWTGRITAVQPRIRLIRSFNERYHNYLGYVLRLEGIYGDESGVFHIAVGKGAHAKHQFHSGMELSGRSAPVQDERLETAGFYKTSGVKVEQTGEVALSETPPVLGIPPDLETYRGRGHRRLDPRTYRAKCELCIWGCRMPVEIIIDHWNPREKEYRFETFCYGPKSCPHYKAGRMRTVPARRGMVWEEEDWIDEDETAHRGPDD